VGVSFSFFFFSFLNIIFFFFFSFFFFFVFSPFFFFFFLVDTSGFHHWVFCLSGPSFGCSFVLEGFDSLTPLRCVNYFYNGVIPYHEFGAF